MIVGVTDDSDAAAAVDPVRRDGRSSRRRSCVGFIMTCIIRLGPVPLSACHNCPSCSCTIIVDRCRRVVGDGDGDFVDRWRWEGFGFCGLLGFGGLRGFPTEGPLFFRVEVERSPHPTKESIH